MRGQGQMVIGTWRRSWIMGLWLGAIALAVIVIRSGDSPWPTHGDATGFYVGSLFVWIIWIPWIVAWRRLAVREREASGHHRVALVLLGAWGALWLSLTAFEHL